MKLKGTGVFYFVVLMILGFFPIIASYKLFSDYKPVRGGQAGSAADEGKVEIRFLSSWGGTDTKAMHLRSILEQFEKQNPNVRIINESMSGAEFLFKLKTNFAQGNDPDVFGLWPGSDIKTLINAGKVADLTALLDGDPAWKALFEKDTWAYDEFNGRIYGLPSEIIYEGLFVNKDLFEKYGAKVPETYDELKSAAVVFRENGVIPIACNATPEGTFIYQNIVAKLGGKHDTENPYWNGKINQCYIDGMKYMKELYELGAFPHNAFTIDDKTRDNLFLDKRAAMIVQGSWLIGQGSLDAQDDTVDIVPFPVFEDGKAHPSAIIYGLGNGNFHMSSQAWQNPEKKEICISLLKHLTSVETAKQFSKGTGFISATRIPDNDIRPGRLYDKGVELIANSQELIGPTDSFLDRNLWEEVLVTRFPRVLEGKLAPEAVFEEMTGGM